MVFSKLKSRKKQKFTNILEKKFGIRVLSEPSQVIAVCNGGLANGLTQEIILENFSVFGDVQDMVLLSGQSLSFIKFSSDESALKAVESTLEINWVGGGPAFLVFVDRLPPHENSENLFKAPPGLLIIEDFITVEEEENLLKCLNIVNAVKELKHRTVKHFGFEFRYSDNRADLKPIDPIPDDFSPLWQRLLEKEGLEFVPDQCTANRFEPGDGIPPHVDTHSAFTELILSLSMQSDVVMDWRKGNDLQHVLLPRRSLCIMTEESRYGWTHGIASKKSDLVPGKSGGFSLLPRQTRTSVTFRKTRLGECYCTFPELCDTVKKRLKENLCKGVTESAANNFENTCVHQVYEEIADHFSETRHKPWPNVVKFLNSFSIGDIIVDIGCGNGKYLGTRTDVALFGCDRSATLSQLCNDRGYPVFTCDCLTVPCRDSSVDGCISIAVLHHLSTKERRIQGIKEMIRILRPGGRALIYVWAKNQKANSKKSFYLKETKEEPIEPSLANVGEVVLPVHTNRTNFASSDMFVPWQKKQSGPTYLRYYHVFEDDELRKMCEDVGHVTCLNYYYDEGNWCIILRKDR